MDITPWIFLLVEIVIVMVILYLATRFVCKEDIVTGAYAVRLFVTALLAVLIVPILIGIFSSMLMQVVAIIIAFFFLVLIIRFIIVSEASLGDEVIESILIAIITLIAIVIINLIAVALLKIKLIDIF